MKVVSETSDMVITCVWGRGHDSVLAVFVLVGKRLDQGARLSFKAKPGILGGQFQNPSAPGIMVIQAKQTLGLCTA